MVLLFTRTTPNRSSLKKSGTECRLKRHFSCRLTWKSDHTKRTNEDTIGTDAIHDSVQDKQLLTSNNDSTSENVNFENSTLMAASIPRQQTSCAHRSLPRYYSNNQGKRNGVFGFGATNGIAYPSSSITHPGGQLLLSCDDSYLASGVRKSDGHDSSLMDSYEFSTDFQQKRVEILERKYGGRIRTRHAAAVIQRAYRKFRLKKKFEDLRLVASDTNRRNDKDKALVLRRFYSNIASCGAISGNKPSIYSGPLKQHCAPILQQQQYHYVSCTKKITETRSEGRILDFRRGVALSSAISQEASPDGQSEKKRGVGVIMGNQHDVNSASFSSSNESNAALRNTSGGSNTSKLKLHRYNVGGANGHHMSAPLTVQLQHVQQQTSPRGNITKGTSSIHVKVTELDSTSTTAISDGFETRDCANRYRPPAVSILRNRSASVERTALLGGNGCPLTLATGKDMHSTKREGILRYPVSHFDNNLYSPGRQQERRGHSGSDSPYAAFIRISPPEVTQQHSSFDNGATSVISSSRLAGCAESELKQCVSPKFASINHSSTSSTRAEVLTFSPKSPAVDSSCEQQISNFSRQSTTGQNSIAISPASKCIAYTTIETVPQQCSSISANYSSKQCGPVKKTSSDHSAAVWLPMDVEIGKGGNSNVPILDLDEVRWESRESRIVLNKSLPESQWLRHWGRKSLISVPFRRSDLERKRQYRIALNFFNKKPERGVQFLVDFGFVAGTPVDVATLLIKRKGLSKQMIGEYLGNLQNPFNMAVLECFANDIDMTGLDLDLALRHFQSLFRLPGEAQKIERIMEVFARRYSDCNPEVARQFRQPDTIFLLAFAIIMLNTDLHSPNIKPERRMKLEDFVKNLRGLDGGSDINLSLLTGIYQRIKDQEFKPGSDHVTQVLRVDRSIVGKKPILPLPHRRLVCYCRLYEVMDVQKKQAPNLHQREVFLFNDLILIAKILSRKKNTVTYTFRSCHTLVGMQVQPFKNQYYANGLRINHTLENKVLFFNARSEEDRTKFMEDLKEAICESDEMEALRIELELEKQNKICAGTAAVSSTSRSHSLGRGEQRDSGLPEFDDQTSSGSAASATHSVTKMANAVSADDHNPSARCSSATSLDSGMSSTASTVSREASPKSSRPQTAMTDVTQTKSLDDMAGAACGNVGLGRPPQIRAYVNLRDNHRNGSSTPPPEVAFFTESSEV